MFDFAGLLGLIGLKKTVEEEDTLTQSDIEKEFQRSKFTNFLLPRAYDPETKIFYCQDETIGLMFEFTPVLLLGAQDAKTLEGLFRAGYPDKTVLQFILYADPDLKVFYDYYENTKQNVPDFIKKAYRSLRKFYESQTYGSPPLRNYRGFLFIKIPVKSITENLLKEVTTNTMEVLKAIQLNPIHCGAEDYLKLMRRLLNTRISQNEEKWDRFSPLNRQVIYSDTEIEFLTSENFIKIKGYDFDENGNQVDKVKYLRCVTPKSLPESINVFWANLITGSYEGVSGDASQINTPFLFVLNIVVEDLKVKLHAKANLVLTQQQQLGSLITSLRRKQNEFIWATGELDKGEKFFRVVPTVWLIGEDKEEVRTAVYRTIRLWESTGAVMQEDKYILGPLFCYSLPFGFYSDSKTLSLLDRDFVVPLQSIPAMLPLQTDFAGTGEPVLMFVGRKGQLIGFNIFAKGASNYNFYVAAPTGKGKSFTVNYLVTNYYGAGAKIRIVDIGGSYKKLVKIFNGKYIDFSPNAGVSINPFSNINLDLEELKYEVSVITQVITQMVISSTGKFPENMNQESATNLIAKAVEWAITKYGRDASIDDIQMWLSRFPEFLDDTSVLCADDKCVEDFKLIATHLAFNLDKFTSAGKYGKWFQGKSTIEIANDDFVVLELEHLKNLKDLFTVVVLQVLNEVTRDLYLSDRQHKRMIVVDEAWQFLQDTPQFQNVIEEGYRRARKYGGSFGIVTQSILDLQDFGRVGRVINDNSAFKFFLESSSFDKAKEANLIDYEGVLLNILKSIRYNAPKYSEIFIHTDEFGKGVARLMVDPYSYYIYTSNPKEISEIESMVSQGLSYEEAINEMVKKYRSND